MEDQPSDRIDHDDLPTHLLCITQSRRRSAAPFSIVYGQQSGGMIYQKTIPLQHTIIVVVPADIDDRISPVKD